MLTGNFLVFYQLRSACTRKKDQQKNKIFLSPPYPLLHVAQRETEREGGMVYVRAYVCVCVHVCVCVLDGEGSWVFTSRALVAAQTAVCPDWLHWLSDWFPHEPLLAAHSCMSWLVTLTVWPVSPWTTSCSTQLYVLTGYTVWPVSPWTTSCSTQLYVLTGYTVWPVSPWTTFAKSGSWGNRSVYQCNQSESGHTAVYAATRALTDVAPVSKNIQHSHCIIKERETDLQTSLLPGNQNVGHVQRLFQFPQFATQRLLVCLLQALLVQTFVLLVAGPVNTVKSESTHKGVYLC